MVSFKVTTRESNIIHKIALRAGRLEKKGSRDQTCVAMDVTAVHANGCYLKLEELLNANDFNFLHDVLGIRDHLNRETGKLEDHFLPRFAG